MKREARVEATKKKVSFKRPFEEHKYARPTEQRPVKEESKHRPRAKNANDAVPLKPALVVRKEKVDSRENKAKKGCKFAVGGVDWKCFYWRQGKCRNEHATCHNGEKTVMVPHGIPTEMKTMLGYKLLSLNGAAKDHPKLSVERYIGEAICYETLRKMNCIHITDIGGNASRHLQLERSEVHSCCPNLSATDQLYGDLREKEANACSNLTQDCDVESDAYMAVHSLYYLTARDVLELVHRSATKTLISIHHRFPDARGEFAGEAQYSVDAKENVVMVVDCTWSHKTLSWLDAGGYSYGGKSIWWKKYRDLKWSEIVVFRATDQIYKPVPKPLFASVVNDHEHHGEVDYSSSARFDPIYQRFKVQINVLLSWGPEVIIESKTENVVVPKNLVCVAAQAVMAKERNLDTFRSVRRTVQNEMRKLRGNSVDSDLVILYATYLGFVKNVDKEIEVCDTIRAQSGRLRKLTRSLNKLTVARSWPIWLGGAIIVGAFGYAAYRLGSWQLSKYEQSNVSRQPLLYQALKKCSVPDNLLCYCPHRTTKEFFDADYGHVLPALYGIAGAAATKYSFSYALKLLGSDTLSEVVGVFSQ